VFKKSNRKDIDLRKYERIKKSMRIKEKRISTDVERR